MAKIAHSTAGTAAAGIPVTLCALAAALGELEPPDIHADMTGDHFQRKDALFAAAAFLPVCSGEDAALALCGVAEQITRILGFDMDERKRDLELRRAMQILAGVAAWVTRQHGAAPLTSMWPQWADPFTDGKGIGA